MDWKLAGIALVFVVVLLALLVVLAVYSSSIIAFPVLTRYSYSRVTVL